MFQGSFKGVSRKFPGCFKEVSRVFQETFKKVLRELQGCLKEVFRVFHRSLKCVSRKFQGCFKKVSIRFCTQCYVVTSGEGQHLKIRRCPG